MGDDPGGGWRSRGAGLYRAEVVRAQAKPFLVIRAKLPARVRREESAVVIVADKSERDERKHRKTFARQIAALEFQRR